MTEIESEQSKFYGPIELPSTWKKNQDIRFRIELLIRRTLINSLISNKRTVEISSHYKNVDVFTVFINNVTKR